MLKKLYCPHKKVVSELAINFIHGQIYLHTQFSPKPWSPVQLEQNLSEVSISIIYLRLLTEQTCKALQHLQVLIYICIRFIQSVILSRNTKLFESIRHLCQLDRYLWLYTQVRDLKLPTFNKSPLIKFCIFSKFPSVCF